MTLEDFFTLTEMKDGLTALSRVEELVTVMQKEKDCSVKNVGDTSRQWIAVASTIAATENKDCLDLFIKLEGLWFIGKWLKDALKFCTDADESFVEESIITLLQALERLRVNNEKSISSGIWVTVKSLLSHKSSAVQDRARILCDSWKQKKDDGSFECEAEKVVVSHDGQSSQLSSEESKPSASCSPSSGETLKVESHALKPSGEVLPNVTTDIQSEKSNQRGSPKPFDTGPMKDRAEASLVSTLSKSVQEISCPMEDSVTCSLGEVSAEITAPQRGTDEEEQDSPKVSEFSRLEKQEDKIEGSVISRTEPKAAESDIDAAVSQDAMKQLTLQDDLEADARQKDCETNLASASDTKGVVREASDLNYCTAAEDGECCSDPLQDSSINDDMAVDPEDLEKSSRMDDIGTDDEDKEDGSDEDRDFRNAYEFSKPVMDTKRSDATDKRRSDVDLDYGVDPLEVARRVAKAVEREVGDFKGTFCSSSSSEKSSEDGLKKQPGSPDSINEKKDIPSEVPSKEEVSTAQSHSAEEKRLRNPGSQGRASDNCNRDLDSSQVTEAAKEIDINVEKGLCGFDLNEEVCSDEADHPINPVLSTTISVVSASRPATTPALPVAPLQFEGALGWKGSAATSAFRPASSRRNSDSDKNPSVGGTSDGSSKQRQDWLDFDLNVAGCGDDLGKQIPASSGHPSGESSVEVSPKTSGRFTLDLNRIEDDTDALPSNSRVHVHNRNGLHSPSPTSSSSSMMQPSLRNFDLNDRPHINESLDRGGGPVKSSQSVNAFVLPKPDASVISIMGTQVEINKKDTSAPPQVLSMSNGEAIEPAVDANLMGTGSFLGLAPSGSYTHSPFFGYNGLTPPPHAMSMPPALYGPGGAIPYIMDSRATIMPQLIPSASPVPPYSQPPFIMTMGNAPPPSLNGAGPSRPNFDLNSGFMVEGGNHRDLGLRQFFVPGPVRPVEEHLRAANLQPPSSSSLSGKRKEPDGGWESFQFGYKQQQPPWR